MKRRTFLEIALVLGAGMAAGGSARFAWSQREGFPGMRVRFEGLGSEADRRGARLNVVDTCQGVDRVVLDQPLVEVGPEWRIPALRRDLVDAVHELEARVVAPDGRVLARTDTPLTVRFRAFRFSV